MLIVGLHCLHVLFYIYMYVNIQVLSSVCGSDNGGGGVISGYLGMSAGQTCTCMYRDDATCTHIHEGKNVVKHDIYKTH